MTSPSPLPSPTVSRCCNHLTLFVATSCSYRALRPSLSCHSFFNFRGTSMAPTLTVSPNIPSLVDLTHFPILLDCMAEHRTGLQHTVLLYHLGKRHRWSSNMKDFNFLTLPANSPSPAPIFSPFLSQRRCLSSLAGMISFSELELVTAHHLGTW